MKTNTDPIFAAHAATAPRLDLAFYLAAAGRPAAFAAFGPGTPAAICQMVATYSELSGPKPGTTTSQKRRAWQAIAQYKASCNASNNIGGPSWSAVVDPTLTGTFDILDAFEALPGETLPALLARYAAASTSEPWWPTDLSGADIVDRALSAALRADAEAERRALEPLIAEADDVRA